jgi:hypothetical protein
MIGLGRSILVGGIVFHKLNNSFGIRILIKYLKNKKITIIKIKIQEKNSYNEIAIDLTVDSIGIPKV